MAIVIHPRDIYDIEDVGNFGKSIKSVGYEVLGSAKKQEVFAVNIDMDIDTDTEPNMTDADWIAEFSRKGYNNIVVEHIEVDGTTATRYRQVFFTTDISIDNPVVGISGKYADPLFPLLTNVILALRGTIPSVIGARLLFYDVEDIDDFVSRQNTSDNVTYFGIQTINDNTIRLYVCTYTYALTGSGVQRRTSVSLTTYSTGTSRNGYYPITKTAPTYMIDSKKANVTARYDGGLNTLQYSMAIGIKNKYEDGIETATIRCAIGNYKDTSDNVAISITDISKPFTFKIGDIVIPYKQTVDGEKPISVDTNGNATKFYVCGVQFPYDGGLSQTLLLRTHTE